jgi:uncharacterized protein YgiB involved in biofilm formation
MKRSTTIALGAIGLLAGAVYLLPSQNSDDDEGMLKYKTLDECRRAGVLDAQACEAEFSRSQEAHLSRAQKFSSLSSCETDYGTANCRPATWQGQNVFIPVMTGIMIARLAERRGNGAQPLFPAFGSARQDCTADPQQAQARPECRNRTGTASSSSSYRSSGSGGASWWHSGSSQGSSPAASRGGFGSSAHSSGG